MDGWTELYRKDTNNSSEIGSITVHIKSNRVIVKNFDQTTLFTRTSEEEAKVVANAIVNVYKKLDETFF